MSEQGNFFHLDDLTDGLARTLADGLEARIFTGEHAMLSIVRVSPGAESALHFHPEEQWGILLEGSGIRVQGGQRVKVVRGSFWRTPPYVPHSFRAGPDGALLLDVFSPPREQYRAEGSGFGAASTGSARRED